MDQGESLENIVDSNEHGEGTKRKLQGRHIQMIAIGGTIGTGLFIGSGSTLAAIGPLGLVVTYMLAGLVVFCVVMSLGEMATYLPITGSFNEYAARMHSPALGFLSGWSYWFNWTMTLPIELQACGFFLAYWFPDVQPVIFYMAILAFILLVNIFSVANFGEVEYWLSFLKVAAIVIFIFTGIVVIFGNNLGFSNYNHGSGALAGASAWGILGKMPNAVFAFGGTELVGITAGEAHNPRKNLPIAIRGTFWRIMIFYFASVTVMGLAIPYDFAADFEEGSIFRSPFVAVMQKAKVWGADHFINFIGFIAVLSAGNSSMYASSRTMMALCKKGNGPAMLGKVNANGIPVVPLLISAGFGLVTIMTLVFKVEAVFEWLVNLVGNLIGIDWTIISIAHIYFRRAYLAQGKKLEDLPYLSPIGIIGDYVAIVFNVTILIFAGLTGYIQGSPFVLKDFLANYVYVISFLILYGMGIFFYGYKTNEPVEVDLDSGNFMIHEKDYEEENAKPETAYSRIIQVIA